MRIFKRADHRRAGPEGLRSISRRQTMEQSERALELCRELGISAQYTIMTFQPESTLETLHTDLQFLWRYIDHPINVAHTEIYAKTPLEQRMIQEGRAVGDYLSRCYRITDPHPENGPGGVASGIPPWGTTP